MDPGIAARVEDWESRPFTGGYGELHDLAAAEFSGAVSATGAWLFMLNGRVVGVFDGSLSAFEHADGTAYQAPHPSLPLLFTMLETGGETEAQYYTNDTPLTEVNETLSEGNFTGYVELSENVLSGDYYVVYYGGRAMSAAFIGNSERLVTGEEAFELANDEVGIYEVTSVDLEVQDVPGGSDTGAPGGAETGSPGGSEASTPGGQGRGTTEPDTGAPAEAGGAGASAGARDEGRADPSPDPGEEPPDDAADPLSEPALDPLPGSGQDDPVPDGLDVAEAAGIDLGEAAGLEDDGPGADTPSGGAGGEQSLDVAEADEAEPVIEEAEPPTGEEMPDGDPTGTEADRPESGEPGGTESTPTPGEDGAVDRIESTGETDEPVPREEPEPGDDPFSEEEAWRETRTIPALDPEETGAESRGAIEEPERAGSAGEPGSREPTEAVEGGGPSQLESEPTDRGSAGGEVAAGELREALESREARLGELEARLEDVTDDRDRLEQERERLKRRVEELEARLRSSGIDADTGSGPSLGHAEALSATDLFVRYGSKGQATLAEAHDGGATKGDVNANLTLEDHTRFEAAGATVEGVRFGEFLERSLEYRFVAWVIQDLLYEIRDTGNQRALRELYDALPDVDRVAFEEEISTRDDAGEEVTRNFDVVFRDRMGQPLLVADVNDARDPATSEMMGDLVDRATGVAGDHDTVVGAFLVTASFFEPGALETAAEATGGGLLNRESRKSFVKQSRKRGYHLCLVEARRDAFHVAVPEL